MLSLANYLLGMFSSKKFHNTKPCCTQYLEDKISKMGDLVFTYGWKTAKDLLKFILDSYLFNQFIIWESIPANLTAVKFNCYNFVVDAICRTQNRWLYIYPGTSRYSGCEALARWTTERNGTKMKLVYMYIQVIEILRACDLSNCLYSPH